MPRPQPPAGSRRLVVQLSLPPGGREAIEAFAAAVHQSVAAWAAGVLLRAAGHRAVDYVAMGAAAVALAKGEAVGKPVDVGTPHVEDAGLITPILEPVHPTGEVGTAEAAYPPTTDPRVACPAHGPYIYGGGLQCRMGCRRPA